MGCRRARRVIFLWIDREREQLPVEPIQRHFDQCPECRERAVRVEKVVGMVRARCRRETAPSGLAERIRILLGVR